MKRREFITLLGGAAASPIAARAQQPGRMHRIGMLIGGPTSDPAWRRYTAAFKQELARLGWLEGGNLRIDIRVVAGDFDHARASATELVNLAPDVIFAGSGLATRAAEQQTQAIPIVYTGPANVIGGENLARPGSNITGFPILYPSIAGKWVELLKEADPQITRAAYMNNNPTITGSGGSSYISFIQEAAPALAVKATAAVYRDDAELERAIDTFAAQPNGGLIVLPSAFTSTRASRDIVRKLAERYKLPTIHWDDSYPAEGGLMSYGSDFEELHRRAAGYVDRILRGAKVSELPIERPTKFELIINTKAAKAIGLTIPEAFLLRADKLIE